MKERVRVMLIHHILSQVKIPAKEHLRITSTYSFISSEDLGEGTPDSDISPTEYRPPREDEVDKQLEQLERLRSEDTPRRLMITHTIESYWIPSQKKTKSKL